MSDHVQTCPVCGGHDHAFCYRDRDKALRMQTAEIVELRRLLKERQHTDSYELSESKLDVVACQKYIAALQAQLAASEQAREELEAERDELEAHEMQTHERLGTILGAHTSLEDAATTMKLRAEQAEAALAAERERAAQAESDRDCYRDTILSRHGGEPLSLLDDLDEARAQLAGSEQARERQKKTIDALMRQAVDVRHQIHCPEGRHLGLFAAETRARAEEAEAEVEKWKWMLQKYLEWNAGHFAPVPVSEVVQNLTNEWTARAGEGSQSDT